MAKKNKTYLTYNYADLRQMNISTIGGKVFERQTMSVAPSEWLNSTLGKSMRLPLNTEKSKSEMIVSPILTELHERNPELFTFFSGPTFDVDKEMGLKGRSDFILSRKYNAIVLESPIFAVVEAKNDGLEEAYPQCIAQLYAAELFNKQHNSPFPVLYGAVTTGFNWKFIRYATKVAVVDQDVYYMENLAELLGALQAIIEVYR